jgi:hypothetical protein
LNYAKKGYLHHPLKLPIVAELCEQVFLSQQKACQCNYAKKECNTKTDMINIEEFCEGCPDADICSGEYKKVAERKEESQLRHKGRERMLS